MIRFFIILIASIIGLLLVTNPKEPEQVVFEKAIHRVTDVIKFDYDLRDTLESMTMVPLPEFKQRLTKWMLMRNVAFNWSPSHDFILIKYADNVFFKYDLTYFDNRLISYHKDTLINYKIDQVMEKRNARDNVGNQTK